MSDIMKRPCEHCPYRHDVKPFLRPERGEELAYHATNKYNSFSCHKTTVPDDESSRMYCTEKTKECAGFVTLQINEGMEIPEGFEPAFDIVYTDAFDMIQAYDEEYRDESKK
jgi:hypothetical protein